MHIYVNRKYIQNIFPRSIGLNNRYCAFVTPNTTSASGSTIKRTHDIITDMPLLKYLNIAKTNKLTSNPPTKRISIMISIYCPTDIFCETRHRCSILAAGALSPCVPYAKSTLHSRTMYTSVNAVTVPKKPSMHLIPICCFLPRQVVLKRRISWFA